MTEDETIAAITAEVRVAMERLKPYAVTPEAMKVQMQNIPDDDIGILLQDVLVSAGEFVDNTWVEAGGAEAAERFAIGQILSAAALLTVCLRRRKQEPHTPERFALLAMHIYDEIAKRLDSPDADNMFVEARKDDAERAAYLEWLNDADLNDLKEEPPHVSP